MIILKKKRLLLTLNLIILALFACIYSISAYEKTTQTVALPVSNKVIILDAGHGYPDGGAEAKNGTTESNINLKIVLKVQNLLEQSGATVLLTRSDENGIYSQDANTLHEMKVSDMNQRVEIGNGSRCRYVCFYSFK